MPEEDIEVCERCEMKHERAGHRTCNGHKRVEGNTGVRLSPCMKYPITGAEVCRTHGGGAPQVRAAAAQREVDRAMTNVLNLLEIKQEHRDRSPDEHLLDEVARSAQAVEWLAQQVSRLYWPDAEETGEMTWVTAIDPDMGDLIEVPMRSRLVGPDHNADLAIHPFWKKLDEERDRHARMAKMAIDAGISERLVRLAESQAQQMVAIVLHVIAALDLTPAQQVTAKKAVAEKMRALRPGTMSVSSIEVPNSGEVPPNTSSPGSVA